MTHDRSHAAQVVAPQIVARPSHLPQRDQLGEAPFWDAATGALWWVDIVGRRVQRLDGETGEVRAWSTPGFPSAAVPCTGGGLVVPMQDGLHRLNLGSGLTTPFARPDADPGNRSNECRADQQGRLWLGTMANNLAKDGAPVPLAGVTGGLFRIEADGRSAPVLGDVGIANTLAWSPDGATLYFADSLKRTIWAFPFDGATGELGERRLFAGPDAAAGEPDGSSIDAEGFLWNARWGAGVVARFAPDGRLDRVVELPASQPTSVAFGGPDLRTMYVTSARQGLDAPGEMDGALFRVAVEVAGLPMTRFAG